MSLYDFLKAAWLKVDISTEILIPRDKANHMVYGAAVAMVTSWAVVWMGHADVAREAGMIASMIAGVIKEGSDAEANYQATGDWRRGQHSVDALDFAATAFGGLLVAARP